MRQRVHLTFAGKCEEAFRFYEQALGGRITALVTYGASPMADSISPERRGHVVHASMALGNTMLAGADVAADEYEKPQGFFVLLSVDGVPEAERVFDVLRENGTVRMPLQTTFWSPAFGVLIDRFGTPWEISVEGA